MPDNSFTEKDKKAIIIKRKLAAFSDFLDKGLPFIEKNFPEEVDFVLEHKNKKYPEIVDMLDKELAAL